MLVFALLEVVAAASWERKVRIRANYPANIAKGESQSKEKCFFHLLWPSRPHIRASKWAKGESQSKEKCFFHLLWLGRPHVRGADYGSRPSLVRYMANR